MISFNINRINFEGTCDSRYVQAITSIFISILLTLEYWCFGPYSAMYGYGGGLETIPVYKGLALTGSTWAYWAPFLAGGLDRLSFWGNADPYNLEPLLFNFLPTWIAAAIHLFLQRIIPIFVIMRIAETQLMIPCKWAILTGIIYGCLSYPTPGYMLSEASIILAIWLIPSISKSAYPFLGSVLLGIFLSTMTAFIWSEPIVPVFVTSWFYIVLNNRNKNYLKTMFVVFVIQFLCETPQLLALINNAPSSHRANWPVEELSFTWSGLFYYQSHYDLFNQDKILKCITIFVPVVSIFIGVSSIIINNFDLKSIYSAFFLRILYIYLLISSKFIFVGLQEIISNIFPWIRGIFMGRIYMIPAPFLIPLMVILSLLIFKNIITKILINYSRKYANLIGILGGVVICITVVFLIFRPKIFLLDELLIHGWGAQNYEITALENIKNIETKPFRVVSVLPLQPSYAYAQGIETADGWANLYPAVYRDLWLKIISPGLVSLPQMKNVIDPEKSRPQDHYIFLNLDLITPGIGQLPNENPEIAIKEGFDLDRRINLQLLSILNVKYILSELPLKGNGIELVGAPSIHPLKDFSRDYATGKLNTPNLNKSIWKTFSAFGEVSDAVERRKKGKEIYIYRNDLALERFRFINKIEKNNNDVEVLDRLSVLDIKSLMYTALIAPEFSDLISDTDGWGSGKVSINSYKPDDIELKLEFEGEKAFLVIANTWNPYWVGYVNGKKRSLMRVNHAQSGLALEKNEFNVHLSYEPPYKKYHILY